MHDSRSFKQTLFVLSVILMTIAPLALANTSVVKSSPCPTQFNSIAIMQTGKVCQIFAADYPASMVYFVPTSPAQVVEYYLSSTSQFESATEVKNRTIMKSRDGNTTLIVSKDKAGTQVDVLVRAPLSLAKTL